jgi:hypothetical protein
MLPLRPSKRAAADTPVLLNLASADWPHVSVFPKRVSNETAGQHAFHAVHI